MRRGRFSKRWIWVVAGVGLPGLAVLIGLFAATRMLTGKAGVLLIGYDSLARLGDPVTLQVKVQRGMGLKDVADAQVTFQPPGADPRSAVTDGDGVASIQVSWDTPGRFIVPVVVSEGAEHSSGKKTRECTVRLYVEPADAPLVVCDVDHTLADISASRVLQAPNDRTPALPGAAEVLERLAATHRIVYLTARDDKLLNKTRDWLALQGFPDGPVFARNFGSDSSSAQKFKTAWLTKLTAVWSNVALGFGDRDEDAAAYDAAGIRSYIVRSEPFDPGELPPSAHYAADWRAIGEHLFAGN